MAEKVYLKDLFLDTSSVYISQDHECIYSHDLTGATDYIQTKGVETPIYAPCDLKLVYSKTNKTNDSLAETNTIILQSAQNIEFPDGSEDKLCISFAHMTNINYDNLKIANWSTTQVIKKGTKIYYTGNYGGGSTGVHVHIRLAKGDFYPNSSCWKKVRDDDLKTPNTNEKRLVLNTDGKTPLKHDEVFYADGINITYNSDKNYANASHYFWKYANNKPEIDSTGLYLQGVLGGFYLRPNPNDKSSNNGFVPKDSKAEILNFESGFYKDASDNLSYQWAKVKYGNNIGYAQLDLHDDYKIVCDSTFNPVYLRAVGSYFNIRSQKNTTSTILGTVAAGSRIKLVAISSTHEAGGYQWARVDYNGQVGFVQIDTVGFNQLEF